MGSYHPRTDSAASARRAYHAAVPELPDIHVYIDALSVRTRGQVLEQVRLGGPSLLRTVDPPLTAVNGKRVLELRRMGKRIVFGLETDLFLVIHLMIAGRLHWKRAAALSRRGGLAPFDFREGSLILTEAGSKRRAALHVVRGEEALAEHDRGGLEVLDAAEVARLFRATQETLITWTERLRDEVGDGFPEKVTAFRPEMAVHGRHQKPCPTCGAPVQRIVYASNETNYCAPCQTVGKLLADRALSRLLKQDWPRSLEELEARTSERRAGTDPQ